MLDLLTARRFQLVLTALLRIAASRNPVSGKLLAEKLTCPRRYLEPDMQALVQHGILESKRGARGGYCLARSPQRITLRDLLTALASAETPADEEDACRLRREVVLPAIEHLVGEIHALLGDVSLAGLLDDAQRRDLLHADTQPDFCI